MRRSLLLNGFMATGKSTVGRRIAELTGAPFVDLDDRVIQTAGKPITQIFKEDGEAQFRVLERAELERVLEDSTPQVVALGGGALLNRGQRLRALQRAVVVNLHADLEVLLRRVAGDDARPLLQGKNTEAVEQLLSSRAPVYAEAHASVDVGQRTPDAIAEDVLAVWRQDPIAVAAGAASYSVEVGSGFAPERTARHVKGASNVVLVTDSTVGGLYAEQYRSALVAQGVTVSLFALEPGEANKNVASLEKIWAHCLAHEADRKTVFVGLGGGVVTDVTGFAAATWMRGVPWVSIPTTLLGMVDASVGGKTAVDLPGAKNCVGAFWQPRRVHCDVAHLASEPSRGINSGLAEVVKTALIGDPELFELLQQRARDVARRDWELIGEVVRRCIAVKARVVSEDERETGFRAALNLGHTVGHALEACDGYGHLTHGEAVSLGLVAALRLGQLHGVTGAQLCQQTERLLAALGLPIDLSSQPLERAATLLGHDKKRGGGSVRFVFCRVPGDIEFHNIPLPTLHEEVCNLR
jgi:shikimate kinase / 3-dehydroquinate synthase